MTEPKHAVRQPTFWLVVLIAALIVSLVLLGWHHTNQYQANTNTKISGLSSAVSQNAQAAKAYQSAFAQANACVRNTHCSSPVPTPSVSVVSGNPGPPGPQGSIGATGPRGPPGHNITLAQAKLAVRSLCANQACGVPPTPQLVAVATAIYCNANGKCKGPKGDTGQTGQQGSQGDIGPQGPQGVQGDPATAQQTADAVSTYCDANNQCRGPTGVGVKSMALDADNHLIITYTDDTTSDIGTIPLCPVGTSLQPVRYLDPNSPPLGTLDGVGCVNNP